MTIEQAVLEYTYSVSFPCVRCGGETGEELREYCDACLEPDPDAALYLEE